MKNKIKILKFYSTAISSTLGTLSLRIFNETDPYTYAILNKGSLLDEALDIKTLDITNSDIKDAVIYRTSDIKLPRDKVEILKKDYNLSVTRDLNKSKYVIISPDTVSKLFTGVHCSWLTLSEFIKNLDKFKKSKYSLDETFDQVIDFLNEKSKNSQFEIGVSFKLHFNNQTTENISELLNLEKTDYYRTHIFKLSDYDTYNDLINCNKLLLDKDLIKFANESAITLTEDNYNYFNDLLENNNVSIPDTNMILSVLANCNYEKSFDIVAALLWSHSNHFKLNSDIWNSINVKTLRAHFSKYVRANEYSRLSMFSNFLEALSEDKKLTEFAFKITSEKVLMFLQKAVGFDESVFEFTIENVRLKSNIKNKLINKIP
jgi:hypothetical protein